MASALLSTSCAQAQYWMSSTITATQSFWLETLKGPTGPVWWNAIYQAVYDCRMALQSTSSAVYVTAKPFCILLFLLTRSLVIWVWNVIVLQGLYNHGLSQAQTVTMWIYRFHLELTKEELLGEIALVAFAVAIYHFRKWLQRQTYISRTIHWYRAKKNNAFRIVKTKYNRTVNQIAKVSLFLAVMTPHMLFVVVSFSVSAIFPRTVRWLACESAFLSILNWWCPVIATLVLLGEIWEQNQLRRDDKEEVDSKENRMPASAVQLRQSKNSKNTLTQKAEQASAPISHPGKTPKTPLFPRTTPSKVEPHRRRSRSSLLEVSQRVLHIRHDDGFTGERTAYWFQYWVVYAFIEGSKRMIFKLPYVTRWLGVAFKVLELIFYLWLHVMPYCIPHLENAPEGRPLVVLSKAFGNYAAITYVSLSNIVSEMWWENRCVYVVKQVADACALVRIISKESATRSADWTRHCRTLLVPAVTLFMPGFMTAYGVLYVQFALPVARASLKEWDEHTELQYWILHALVSAVVENFAGLLWWIPFSNHMVFFLFVWLSFPKNVKEYFGYLRHDLQLLGIFPALGGDTEKETRIGKLLTRLISMLPRAQDVDDQKMSENEDDSNQDHVMVGDAETSKNQSFNKENADVLDDSRSRSTHVTKNIGVGELPSTPDVPDCREGQVITSQPRRAATRRSARLRSKS